MAQPTVHRDSFILRIWREGKSQAWKGWVQHANSGDSALVNTPAELLAFIEQQSGGAMPKADPGKHSESSLDAKYEALRSQNALPQYDQAKKKGSGLK